MRGHHDIQGIREHYELQPPRAQPEAVRSHPTIRYWSKRYARCSVSILLIFIALVLLGKFYSPDAVEHAYGGMRLFAPTERPRLPSLFTKYSENESRVSRRNVRLWEDQGNETRYLRIPVRRQRYGWGLFMQEFVLDSYLAGRTDRILVVDNFTWHEDGQVDYANHDPVDFPMPVQLPVSAIIRVPMPADGEPQMVHAIAGDVWNEFCPHSLPAGHADVTMATSQYSQATPVPLLRSIGALKTVNDRCLELAKNPIKLDGDMLLDIWPSLSTSSILTYFGWSALVELAFDMNRELISPVPRLEPYMSSTPFTKSADRYGPIPGLLVLHLPRGLYQDYCGSLVADVHAFTGFNAFPSLPDSFDTSALAGLNDAERLIMYHRRCYPIIPEIVRRVGSIRRGDLGKDLHNVYIMTNAPASWLLELKMALRRMGGWTSVSSTRDLVLSREQRYVTEGVDMLVAQRAEVFVGNGFSAESGQVVMLRMANGLPMESTRHW